MNQVNLAEKLATLAEHWQPRTVGQFNGHDLMVVKAQGEFVRHKLWNIYFWVSDVDALHAESVRRGAKIDYGLCDRPYGCRELGTQDLDGHDIGFGQPMK